MTQVKAAHAEGIAIRQRQRPHLQCTRKRDGAQMKAVKALDRKPARAGVAGTGGPPEMKVAAKPSRAKPAAAKATTERPGAD
ncbi:MAG: hypothetical protein L6R19_05635 [Alphaproteobacteria bacterium]|nr:hypothetical protein [Alphaproteobacteria bacterium]